MSRTPFFWPAPRPWEDPYSNYARRIPARQENAMTHETEPPNPSRSGSCLGAALAVALDRNTTSAQVDAALTAALDPKPALGMIDRPLSPELLAAGECIAALRECRRAALAIRAAADAGDIPVPLNEAGERALSATYDALDAATRALARVDGAA